MMAKAEGFFESARFGHLCAGKNTFLLIVTSFFSADLTNQIRDGVPLFRSLRIRSIRFHMLPKYPAIWKRGTTFSAGLGTDPTVRSFWVKRRSRERGASLEDRVSSRVAIKYMTSVFNNRDDALRTLREISILRQCHHPNINKIMDAYIPRTKETFNSVWIVLVCAVLNGLSCRSTEAGIWKR